MSQGQVRRQVWGGIRVMVGNEAELLCTIPDDLTGGQMTFFRLSPGSTCYVGVAGKHPNPTDAYIICRDGQASFTEDGIVPGEVRAYCDTPGALFNFYITASKE